MRARLSLCICALFVLTCSMLIAQDRDVPSTPQPQDNASSSDPTIEGTVVTSTRNTLVVRDDNDRYHLFTYDRDTNRTQPVRAGERVRVNAGAADEDGTRVATNVDVLQPAPGAADGTAPQGVHAAPPPPQVTHVEGEIENEARRWHAGGRIGVGFSPELFLFGVQSQIGPIFNKHIIFRPNSDFEFGELTDMWDLNLEGAYRFNTTLRHGWSPYFGLGPSLNFIHQGINKNDVSFGNFDYKTGFNVLIGAQKRRTFVEMKTSLWSAEAPVLRLIIGYNF
jgi:hypothetical protein